MKGYIPLIFYVYQNYLVSVDNSRELIQSKDWLPTPGVIPITDYTGRLRQNGLPFLGFRYIEG